MTVRTNNAILAGQELAFISAKRSLLRNHYNTDTCALDAEFADVVALTHPNATACRLKFRAASVSLDRIQAAAAAYFAKAHSLFQQEKNRN
jgi:hypothetical protein